MLHYENKVEMLKTENSNYFLYKEVWNFSVIGVLLVCSYGNTQVNVWGIGGGGDNNKNHHHFPPPNHPKLSEGQNWHGTNCTLFNICPGTNVQIFLRSSCLLLIL